MDPFLLNYTGDERRTAAEFLSNWIPFLSRGLCKSCTGILSDRIRSINNEKSSVASSWSNVDSEQCKGGSNCGTYSIGNRDDIEYNNDNADTHSLGSWKDEAEWSEHAAGVSSTSETFSSSANFASPELKKSWADMAQEDELAEEEENEVSSKMIDACDTLGEGTFLDEAKPKVTLSRDQREYIRFSSVKRQKDFICLERVHGRPMNIVSGLELHTGVFSAAEQKRIVSYVEELRDMGRDGQLKDRTFSAPAKWMRGKGRVTLQFGCGYNYATDKLGNPPGIMKNETVDPLPHLFKVMIKRLVRWHVLPPSCVPDSCIVNIYEEGDCIPPHIDNHDFVRPFCTVSFLSECEIVFGSNLKIVGPGEFAGSFAIPLPVGSVLVLNGNGADVAKHCVPAVPTKRISITFRKMDESKWPAGYVPEPDLQGIQPLPTSEVDELKQNNASRTAHSFRRPTVGREERVGWGRGAVVNRGVHFGRNRQGDLDRPRFRSNSRN